MYKDGNIPEDFAKSKILLIKEILQNVKIIEQ